MKTECGGTCERVVLLARIAQLESWVADLQSGMYINCVYCGHRYGPEDEVKATMAEALYEHIAKCEAHPLAVANKQVALLEKRLEDPDYLIQAVRRHPDVCMCNDSLHKRGFGCL